SSDTPVGVVQQGKMLTIDRWEHAPWRIDLGSEVAKWAITPDFQRVAWISDGKLYSREETGTPAAITLPAARPPLAVGALSGGALAVSFADSSVERWDAATGRSLGSFRVPLAGLDQAVIEGDYLGVASTTARAMQLYRFKEQTWKLVQQGPVPDYE